MSPAESSPGVFLEQQGANVAKREGSQKSRFAQKASSTLFHYLVFT